MESKHAPHACWHMAGWVDRMAIGNLSGFARWYTSLHLGQCRQCRATLEALRRIQTQLRTLKTEVGLSENRKRSLAAAMDALEDRENFS